MAIRDSDVVKADRLGAAAPVVESNANRRPLWLPSQGVQVRLCPRGLKLCLASEALRGLHADALDPPRGVVQAPVYPLDRWLYGNEIRGSNDSCGSEIHFLDHHVGLDRAQQCAGGGWQSRRS